jgi:hypothetical protein
MIIAIRGGLVATDPDASNNKSASRQNLDAII